MNSITEMSTRSTNTALDDIFESKMVVLQSPMSKVSTFDDAIKIREEDCSNTANQPSAATESAEISQNKATFVPLDDFGMYQAVPSFSLSKMPKDNAADSSQQRQRGVEQQPHKASLNRQCCVGKSFGDGGALIRDDGDDGNVRKLEQASLESPMMQEGASLLAVVTNDEEDDLIQHEDREESQRDDDLRPKQQEEQQEKVQEFNKEDGDSSKKTTDGEEMTTLEMVRKGAVAAVGGTLVGLGLVLVPLPIPLGVPVTCGGLAVLGTEFEEAREMNEKLIQDTKDKLANARDHAIKTIESMESTVEQEDGSSCNYESDDEFDEWLTSNPEELTKFEAMMKTKYRKEDYREPPSWKKSTSNFLSRNVLPILKRTKLGETEAVEDYKREDDDGCTQEKNAVVASGAIGNTSTRTDNHAPSIVIKKDDDDEEDVVKDCVILIRSEEDEDNDLSDVALSPVNYSSGPRSSSRTLEVMVVK